MSPKKHRIEIKAEECKGCKRCLPVCPKNLIAIGDALNKQGYFAAVVEHPEQCIGCGSCFYECPEPGAITIYEITEE